MKHKICYLIFLFAVPLILFGQTFQIIYTAYPIKISDQWLDSIKAWGATGVAVFVSWGEFQYDAPPAPVHWTSSHPNGINLDATINMIHSKGLSVQLRVQFGEWPGWVTSNPSDYATLANGSFFTMYNNNPRLNFASPTTRTAMLNFYTELLEHVRNSWGSEVIPPNSLTEICPTISPDAELEYTWSVMLGYSSIEITNFQNFLTQKYDNINALNSKWSSSFRYFFQINPRNYNWNSNNNSSYIFPSGRVDWLNFRTSLLKNFIDTLAFVTHSKEFKSEKFRMILQVGSLYDDNIENRGWLDPTSLIENVDRVVNGDIVEYKPSFGIAADYIRSLCQYWERINGRKHSFSTESNNAWNNGHTPTTLISGWTDQLTKYRNKGADIHYVSHWDGYIHSYSTPTDPYTVSQYLGWRKILNQYKNKPLIALPNYTRAVHLSCERLAFTHNKKGQWDSVNVIFDLDSSIMQQPPYVSMTNNNYNGACDIITNVMIEKNPTYINRYSNQLWFTRGSEYISDKAYLALMRTNNVVWAGMQNATGYNNGVHNVYAYTQGIYDEYNGYRSPVHLIWKSRGDLRTIWPSASLPAPNSGHTEDFISWAYNYGCGYAYNPRNPEYPRWEIYGAYGLFQYDKNIRSVWNSRSDLQSIFNDAHYNYHPPYTQDIATMIEWARNYGDPAEHLALLSNYRYWPYIGGTSPLGKQESMLNLESNPTEFSLYQNYPNPFNPTTTIGYQLPKDSHIKLVVFDMLGKVIRTLVDEQKTTGSYKVEFNANNLSSGVYFYRLQTNGFTQTKKLILMR